MKREFLLEICTEELPPLIIERIGKQVERFIGNTLEKSRIMYNELELYLTMRRIVIHSEGVDEMGGIKETEIEGPPKRIAFGADGSPTPAAIGFAKKYGIELERLRTKKTERGEYIVAMVEEGGERTIDVLRRAISELLSHISFDKGMRWEDSCLLFPRPIRNILALFGDETIHLEKSGVPSNRYSSGNFISHPDPFEVRDFKMYIEELEKRGVLLDHRERMKRIVTLIDEEANRLGAVPLLEKPSSTENDPLLEELNYSLEFPCAGTGRFDEEFLRMPEHILYSVMKKAQRYIPLKNPEGSPLPFFIFFYGNPLGDRDEIRKNNERVLRARLYDGLYFFEEDRKTRLSDRVEELKSVLFYEGLGTYYDKSCRISNLSQWFSQYLELDRKIAEVSRRAGWLSKADLKTKVVAEFPDLQGSMGGEYALLDGERPEVALAISEHYLPVSIRGDIPGSVAGRVVSMADKFDTLTGFFIKGMVPDSAHDPFGLRRAALGIIRILIDWRRRREISMKEIIEKAIDLFVEQSEGSLRFDRDATVHELLVFFNQRLKYLLIEEGDTGDIVDAVMEGGSDDPLSIYLRTKALTKFKGEKNFPSLMLAFKRVMNIAGTTPVIEFRPELLKEEGEARLLESYTTMEKSFSEHVRRRDYDSALEILLDMKPHIDYFFDNVLVMHPNEDIRNNRLALLRLLSSTFLKVANFSRVSTLDSKGE